MTFLLVLVGTFSSSEAAAGQSAAPNSPGLRVKSISTGGGHACGILPSRFAVCWGKNDYGQLGTGNTRSSTLPVRVKGLGRVRQIEASDGLFTCAIRITGRVMCWGDNYDAILGMKLDRSLRPRRVAGLKGVTQLSSSPINICALQVSGKVLCWGNKGGFGSKAGVRPRPVKVPGVGVATSVAAGTYSSCAVRRDHRVVCWSNPELRLRSKRNLGRVRSLEISLESGCALRVTNRLVCWGDNFEGMLGVGKRPEYSAKPLRIPNLGRIRRFSTDGSTVCAVRFSGRVLCWGANEGAVGDGTRRGRYRPVLLKDLIGARTISVESGRVCATTSDLAGYCWGFNLYGELGDGTRKTRLRPSRVLR